jgi:hypothetical protein
MRCTDVPARGLMHVVDQEQRLGEVTDVDDVPQLVPRFVRASCIYQCSKMSSRVTCVKKKLQ